jgi:hypothetical protein
VDERGYRDNLKKIILDMAQVELENYVSQKGAKKYFEGNVDKMINENIKKFTQTMSTNKVYLRVIKHSSYQENLSSVARIIKKEELFRSRNELVKFAKHLGLDVSSRASYNQILRKVSTHIYENKDRYSKKYVSYKRGNEEYILEPEEIKKDLIESYKSKTREDMKSIAKLLEVKVDDKDGAEDIRKKVINSILRDKLIKRK